MEPLQWGIWALSLGIQFAVVWRLLDGAYREFTGLLIYVIFLIISTLGDITAYYYWPHNTREYYYYYWIAELLRQTGLYAVTVALVLYALPRTRTRSAVLRMLIAAALLFWIGSVLIHNQAAFAKWLNSVVRDLSFGSAVVTLCAWFFFIRAERRDARLLMVTAGLGLQMTGDAMGESLLQMIPGLRFVGGMVIVAAHLLCLVIWFYAFRRPAQPPLVRSFDASPPAV